MNPTTMKWSLSNSCEKKFVVGQKVQTRGDMGRFRLKITQIHNSHYCACRSWLWGKERHFNMNCLESLNIIHKTNRAAGK